MLQSNVANMHISSKETSYSNETYAIEQLRKGFNIHSAESSNQEQFKRESTKDSREKRSGKVTEKGHRIEEPTHGAWGAQPTEEPTHGASWSRSTESNSTRQLGAGKEPLTKQSSEQLRLESADQEAIKKTREQTGTGTRTGYSGVQSRSELSFDQSIAIRSDLSSASSYSIEEDDELSSLLEQQKSNK